MDKYWTHLYWLATLAEQGSYTGAAQRLSVSKAAMSQKIAELEKVAGVALVTRTTRSVRLTEAGQRLVDEIRPSFEGISHALSRVADMASEPRGLVRVTAPVALGRQQLVPTLPDFLARNPQVRIELELSDRIVSLATEGFDLAIRHVSDAPETHVAWRLCETRTLLVASPGYLRRHGEVNTPDDLSQHNCLTYPRPHSPSTWTFEKVARKRNGEKTTVPVSGNFAANNSEALRQAALSGVGLALLPDFSAQAEIAQGHLVPVLPQWRPAGGFASSIFAIRPYSPFAPRAVSALVEHLKQAFKAGF